ncbi:MAG: DNA translocase FtsK, partial [Candidatus Omnitrophica bacterium]|nr:DNA translocase FtsK [Candidatus Omnitrophota bacterium]
MSVFLMRYFGKLGASIILVTFGFLSVTLATEFLISPYVFTLIDIVKRSSSSLRGLFDKSKTLRTNPAVKVRPALREKTFNKEAPREINKSWALNVNKPPEIRISSPAIKQSGVASKIASDKTRQETAALKANDSQTKDFIPGTSKPQDFKLPPLSLLDSPPPIEERKIKEDLEIISRILEDTLRDFSIEAKVVRVERGPVVTLYELQPAPGVKINKISSLSDDIALVMKASSVRVVAPLPGRGTVGVEVPNSTSTIVYLKELLESKEFSETKSRIAIALGKDIAGNTLISDLDDMPHLLIAGATGSGKTVCVNAIIMSLLSRSTPEELRLLLIDPKMVELAMFNGLPHLICPVVTDAKKTCSALGWLVEEMEARYRLLAKAGVRNIGAYNDKTESGFKLSEEEINNDETNTGSPHRFIPGKKLPYIVVLIDELADLMLVSSRDIEEAITRLAQLSRAVGIHLILATQRPSVDVVTGVIKANFPARISFQVASKVDSRTVLDMNGADKLLGKGDMLFLKPGTSKPVRAQGSLVSDKEIERTVAFLKSQAQPEYNEGLLKEQEKRFSSFSLEKDEMYDEAVKVIMESGQASASILQRRLRLGFTRAARLIDMMEDEGIVGPYRGS